MSAIPMAVDRARSRARVAGLGVVLISLALPAAARAETSPPASHAGTPAEPAQEAWPAFRGPGGRGHAVEATPPLSWNVEDGTNILWKAPVPTHGMSSPVVWGKRLFLTGADEAGRQLFCFDTDTGELLWRHDVNGVPGFPADSELPGVLDQTGWAAPTPTTNGRYVAAVFATGELVGVNMEGERVWARHLGVPENAYGHASSLMSHGDLLFVQYDQEVDPKLLAFDFASGDPVWEAKRGAMSWSSPILVDNAGRMELILTNSAAVDSYDPTSGRLLWRVECLGGEIGSSAAHADGIVFVAGEGTTGSALDVSRHDAEPRVLWQWDESLPDAASSLVKDGYVVVPTSFGVVTCLEMKTGRVLWEHDFDRGFWSSPVAVDDRVYLIDRAGAMQVFALGSTFELLAESKIAEGAYATPAFVGDRIYIRGLTHLFCIGPEAE